MHGVARARRGDLFTAVVHTSSSFGHSSLDVRRQTEGRLRVTAASTMLSPSAAEQAVFFATHEIEPNDERLLLRYKKELDEIPLWILFLRPKSRQPLALQRLRTAGVPNFVWNRHKIGAQLPRLAAALARAERDNGSAYSQTPEPNLKLWGRT